MSGRTGLFSAISKSGFARSVITRAMGILIVVSIIIASIAFYSFKSDLRSAMILDRQQQLCNIEETFSARMEEVSSIAYNIGNDPIFYLENIDNDPKAGIEMSETIGRYLVGNSFIEHLAFCRTAEPDKIYVRTGERSLSDFFVGEMHMPKEAAQQVIDHIQSSNKNEIKLSEGGDNAYITYCYPLPQLAAVPKAHVLVMIPVREVRPVMETLLINGSGAAAVFDSEGQEIYAVGSLPEGLDLAEYAKQGEAQEERKAPSGERYVLQKVVSDDNGWSYVSVMRHSDTLSGLADKQVTLIINILLLMAVAMIIILMTVISQFKPISTLAAQVADGKSEGGDELIDERALLSESFATLRDDSEQKQKFQSAYQEAEAASNAKTAFLSSMSHDIRTPMNAIIGMTAIARAHIGEQDYVDECLKKVEDSSNYLLDIINNVLDMSRIESGRIPIAKEPLVIPALMDSVVSLMSSSANAKEQILSLDVGHLERSAVLGDGIHIIQVFVNILSNAVKFTPKGGQIDIQVRQEAGGEGEGLYVFRFADTGVGIPPEFIDKVFDTFTRAGDSMTSRTEGTGLGMAIAKKLTELMGGTIECESEMGKGTEFTVRLPLSYADEKDILPTAGEKRRGGGDSGVADFSGRRILLVEDNAMNREIAKVILGETGAEIETAVNGQEAVDAFAGHPSSYYDLILMDIQMPVMNGIDAAKAIRAMVRDDAAAVPIYAMTANTFDEDVRAVREAGMDGHVGKPYTPQVLYKVLSDIFSA